MDDRVGALTWTFLLWDAFASRFFVLVALLADARVHAALVRTELHVASDAVPIRRALETNFVFIGTTTFCILREASA